MIKIRAERISGNTPLDNHRGRNAAFGKKGRFCPLLSLLLILLLPFTLAADSLTCSRLPVLMEHFQANHYAIKSMTEEV
ncbi:MAG: hypothetical protein U1D67_07970, partial [Dehalococcoidia bacterium]|nr:hypothetical protein [Dehalococcoidia bacterium]